MSLRMTHGGLYPRLAYPLSMPQDATTGRAALVCT